MEKDEKNCPELRLYIGRTSMFHGFIRHLFNSNFVKKIKKLGFPYETFLQFKFCQKINKKWDFLKVELLLVKNCHIPIGFLLGMQVG